jgi:hypothetical protein
MSEASAEAAFQQAFRDITPARAEWEQRRDSNSPRDSRSRLLGVHSILVRFAERLGYDPPPADPFAADFMAALLVWGNRLLGRLERTAATETPRIGLETSPGALRYHKITVPLAGKPWDCVDAFLNARGYALSYREILEQVWGDSYADKKTVEVHISKARRAIVKLARRAGLPVPRDFDPLPCVERRDKLAWKLDFPW